MIIDVKVNGRTYIKELHISHLVPTKDLLDLARSNGVIMEAIGKRQIVKEVYVPRKMINIIVR